jgi:ABC-type transport system substrate-binding protein
MLLKSGKPKEQLTLKGNPDYWGDSAFLGQIRFIPTTMTQR